MLSLSLVDFIKITYTAETRTVLCCSQRTTQTSTGSELSGRT